MHLLKSRKFEIPTLYFITDREEIKDIPIGVPFIYGEPQDEAIFVRILEYEVLYQNAVATGYPFNFRKILMENGYLDLLSYSFTKAEYYHVDFTTSDLSKEDEIERESKSLTSKEVKQQLYKYIRDSSVYVDIEKLKGLKIFPVWFEKVESAVKANIQNFATVNPYMYNKKLGGMYGGIEMTPPPRNLFIIDISGSIPRGVSSTCLTLAKHLSSTFFADLLITGSKSTLYYYEDVPNLTVSGVYEENGEDNDQVYFKNLVSKEERHYKTAIVFGDDHQPGYSWRNKYNVNNGTITLKDGKKLNKWRVDKLISFHTNSAVNLAGYSLWFEPKEIEKVKNWVKYL